MSDATIILGRNGMGDDANEADFDAWVAYVAERIGNETGLDINVEVHGPRDIQDTVVRGDRALHGESIDYALILLWEAFCADTSAWPV